MRLLSRARQPGSTTVILVRVAMIRAIRHCRGLTIGPLLETRLGEDAAQGADGADGHADEVLDQGE